jgi:anti-sigma regulatory factor (Ser/Thr protein kinase)
MTSVFRHEAALCSGDDDTLATTLDHLRGGLDAGASTTLVAPAARTTRVRRALGAQGQRVRFQAIEEFGRNPARLIPFWADQVTASASAGQPLCGVSEALEPASGLDLITEFGLNESLVNVAFEAGPEWTLFCPYDVNAHREETIRFVRAHHPFITENGSTRANPSYRPDSSFGADLSDPPAYAEAIAFGADELPRLRRMALERAQASGFRERAHDFMLAVSEIATNSIRYGGGSGSLTLWDEDGELVCDVSDAGQITDPLVGRVRPYSRPGGAGGAGIWIANRLSDLVQIRSGEDGTRVRIHLDRGER